jgi:hypothetical protein
MAAIIGVNVSVGCTRGSQRLTDIGDVGPEAAREKSFVPYAKKRDCSPDGQTCGDSEARLDKKRMSRGECGKDGGEDPSAPGGQTSPRGDVRWLDDLDRSRDILGLMAFLVGPVRVGDCRD